MNRQTVFTIIAAILLITSKTWTENLSERSSDPNEIFNSIMQTMPENMKNRIDSASATQQNGNMAGTQTPSVHQVSPSPDAKQASIENLPEALREQVRRTMKELEKGSTERMLQFKEIQIQHQGK